MKGTAVLSKSGEICDAEDDFGGGADGSPSSTSTVCCCCCCWLVFLLLLLVSLIILTSKFGGEVVDDELYLELKTIKNVTKRSKPKINIGRDIKYYFLNWGFIFIKNAVNFFCYRHIHLIFQTQCVC